ncbi:MAG: putative DNA binding domain-containing protein [Candidatus Kapabacteria bacterium]|jgi:predicted HTH transcriptional regulator|nr:putative DNA binding domain-containing protein [Candidatus Kapabacteria bacterium]
MTPEELLDIIELGESSHVQFKERLTDAHALSQEFAAFANGKGGRVIVGVNDKTGALSGLTFALIREYNEIAAHAATNNLLPPIAIETEQVRIGDEILMVITVPQGSNKPYKDKNGTMWMKIAADKRRITANEEIARLLQDSGTLYADEMVVLGSSITEIIPEEANRWCEKRYEGTWETLNKAIEEALGEAHLVKGEALTLAGLVLLGKYPQKYRPECSIKCLALPGMTLIADTFLDSEPSLYGNYSEVFSRAMSFFERNLRKIPAGTGFNAQSQWEIPAQALQELVVNALVHRNYFIRSEVRIAIFTDRIEIISPGTLPNSLTIESIKAGTAIPRNPILQQNAQYLLPYKGWGTGIRRALEFYPHIDFINDTERQLFTAIIRRNVS